MKENICQEEAKFWLTLTEGQEVEVYDRRGVTLARGFVETSAPGIGVTWIRTQDGERKLLDINTDYLRPASQDEAHTQTVT